jgi:hypothetical protein
MNRSGFDGTKYGVTAAGPVRLRNRPPYLRSARHRSMQYHCPQCHAPVDAAAPGCTFCPARFDAASAWSPVPEPAAKRSKIGARLLGWSLVLAGFALPWVAAAVSNVEMADAVMYYLLSLVSIPVGTVLGVGVLLGNRSAKRFVNRS